MALISCLFGGLLLPLARPVTLLILGRKWEQAAVIFAGFCLSAMCGPLATGASWLFTSQGRGKEMLLKTSLISGIFVVSVAIGLPFGPVGVAISTSVIGVLIGVPVMFYLAGRNGPVTTADLWLGFLRCVPLWAVVFAATFSMYLFLHDSASIVQVAICAPVGMATGALMIWISAPLRRTALGLMNLRRELLSRDQQ